VIEKTEGMEEKKRREKEGRKKTARRTVGVAHRRRRQP